MFHLGGKEGDKMKKKNKINTSKSNKRTSRFIALTKSEKAELEVKKTEAALFVRNNIKIEGVIPHRLKLLVAKGDGIPANYRFRCSICCNMHSKGHIYKLGLSERVVCKFCEDEIQHKKSNTKLIYIPMGNKK